MPTEGRLLFCPYSGLVTSSSIACSVHEASRVTISLPAGEFVDRFGAEDYSALALTGRGAGLQHA